VDGESIVDFESGLRDNLYKIWNRMSSGTYFPPPASFTLNGTVCATTYSS
jgi:retron-type reverse transcriptase